MKYQIITFYEFKPLGALGELSDIKSRLLSAMRENYILGTIILAKEGFNSTVCGSPVGIAEFIKQSERFLQTRIFYKSSFHESVPFRRAEVKIKPEIVTLKKSVDIMKGAGTHVKPKDWNRLIADPDVLLLDARNDYEFKNGTFVGAINPETSKFSDLPEFVENNFRDRRDVKVAMFCTGGIRCEKFAPYMKQLGFESVFQLEGGILKYLEEIPAGESLWQGECYVFDTRISVDKDLKKGKGRDYSQTAS